MEELGGAVGRGGRAHRKDFGKRKSLNTAQAYQMVVINCSKKTERSGQCMRH